MLIRCSIGDSIVYRLVQWTKRLPFYDELPVHVHTQVPIHLSIDHSVENTSG
jgi:hypothetical protein